MGVGGRLSTSVAWIESVLVCAPAFHLGLTNNTSLARHAVVAPTRYHDRPPRSPPPTTTRSSRASATAPRRGACAPGASFGSPGASRSRASGTPTGEQARERSHSFHAPPSSLCARGRLTPQIPRPRSHYMHKLQGLLRGRYRGSALDSFWLGLRGPRTTN